MDTADAPASRIEITEALEGEQTNPSEEESEKMDVQQTEEEKTAEKSLESEPFEPLVKSFTTSEEDDEEGFEKNDSLNDGNTYIAWKPDVAQQVVSEIQLFVFIASL